MSSEPNVPCRSRRRSGTRRQRVASTLGIAGHIDRRCGQLSPDGQAPLPLSQRPLTRAHCSELPDHGDLTIATAASNYKSVISSVFEFSIGSWDGQKIPNILVVMSRITCFRRNPSFSRFDLAIRSPDWAIRADAKQRSSMPQVEVLVQKSSGPRGFPRCRKDRLEAFRGRAKAGMALWSCLTGRRGQVMLNCGSSQCKATAFQSGINWRSIGPAWLPGATAGAGRLRWIRRAASASGGPGCARRPARPSGLVWPLAGAADPVWSRASQGDAARFRGRSRSGRLFRRSHALRGNEDHFGSSAVVMGEEPQNQGRQKRHSLRPRWSAFNPGTAR
jgi:hypothetical protein